jgi:hypothetical protein
MTSDDGSPCGPSTAWTSSAALPSRAVPGALHRPSSRWRTATGSWPTSCSPSARGRSGLPPWAAAQGAPGAVELLVAAGFDVNALGRSDVPGNQPWHTALHVAAEKGDLALARTLLDLGADPDILDKHHQSTPLGWARYFDQPAVADLLEPVTRGESPAGQQ